MSKIIQANQEINNQISELIKNDLINYTCQFFEKTPFGMKPFASGVFAELGKNFYILTASHGSTHLSKKNDLFIRCRTGYVSVIGYIRETDIDTSNNIDLAYIKLYPELGSDINKNYKFLPISKFYIHNKLFDAANYCILGFPERNQKIENGKLRTGASAYVLQPSKEIVYQYYKLNPPFFYMLEFKGKGIDLKSGHQNKLSDEFYGISGCGLWLLLINSNGQEYSIDYRLIGIMTEYRKGKYYCLIGNRIEILLQGLKKFEGLNWKIQNT